MTIPRALPPAALALLCLLNGAACLLPAAAPAPLRARTALAAAGGMRAFGDRGGGRSGSGRGASRRQERVGTMVQRTLADIVRQGGVGKRRKADGTGESGGITDALRTRISVVDVDMSPDLCNARVTLSVLGSNELDKREAYAWAVRETVPIRKALAKKLKDFRRVPQLSFRQADVGAAVDVMDLIDKLSADANYVDGERGLGLVDGLDFEDGDDDGLFLFDDDDDDDEDEDDDDEGFDQEEEDDYLMNSSSE